MTTMCAPRAATQLTILLLAASAILANATVADAAGRKTLQILFIGNSYTYSDNLSGIVAAIAEAHRDGPQIATSLIAHSGATLRWHLTNGRASAALKKQHWDYVVLQEQGMLGGDVSDSKAPLGSTEAFHASVREWVAQIRSVGAAPVLLMTWARDLPRHDRIAQQEKLSAAYQSIGRELNLKVAPAGLAWEEAFRLMPALVLHAPDGAHASQLGAYLNACVVYAAITGEDPHGAPSTILGNPVTVDATAGEPMPDVTETVPLAELGPATAAEMQKVAWKVVRSADGHGATQ